jgi:hypothetical protein
MLGLFAVTAEWRYLAKLLILEFVTLSNVNHTLSTFLGVSRSVFYTLPAGCYLTTLSGMKLSKINRPLPYP